jgi:protein-tyrosine phosphatase
VCGGEVDIEMVARLSDQDLSAVAQGPANRRWLLLEAPLRGLDESYTAAADELRARRFGVVVAHPERALDGSDAGWEALEHELAAGSPLQINAWSVAGLYGERARNLALGLLERAPRAVIASDAHGGSRMPALWLALDSLAAAGIPEPIRFVAAAPKALLEHGMPARRDAVAA